MSDEHSSPGALALLAMAVPAAAIGAGSAIILWLIDLAAEALHHVVWGTLPAAFGATGDSAWWIVLVLTAVGFAVGAIVQFAPGHAGDDSATTELAITPPPLIALPTLALVLVLGLAGGVSLGPENPVIAINAAIAVTIVARLTTRVPPPLVVLLATSATIGALFGTPVAAALILPGMMGAMRGRGSLWDKLFLPLTSAAVGAVTMLLLGGPSLSFQLEPLGAILPIHLLGGTVIAVLSALLGVAAAVLFPLVHRAFHALKHPIVFTTLGGLILGILGVVGTPMTMFKGLNETAELLTNPDAYSAGELTLFVGVKILALLVAASAGFRGGRIFPIVFIGVAFGLLAHELIPDVPLSLAVACGVLGITLASTRDGWIAMFIALALVGDVQILPLLCLFILPTWLVVTKAPELVVTRRDAKGSVTRV